MTIRWYDYANELDGSENGKLKAGRFELLMVAIDKACGKRRYKKTWFTVVGTTVAAVEAFAVHMAEQIGKLSDGVITKLTKTVGHYRNDEQPEIVAANKRQAGYVIASNGCDPDSPDLMSQKVIIPFASEDVSRTDLRGLVTQISDGLGTAGLGKIRWKDSLKTQLETFYLDEAIGAGVSDYEKLSNFELVSNDIGEGVDASDPVLGEAA